MSEVSRRGPAKSRCGKRRTAVRPNHARLGDWFPSPRSQLPILRIADYSLSARTMLLPTMFPGSFRPVAKADANGNRMSCRSSSDVTACPVWSISSLARQWRIVSSVPIMAGILERDPKRARMGLRARASATGHGSGDIAEFKPMGSVRVWQIR